MAVQFCSEIFILSLAFLFSIEDREAGPLRKKIFFLKPEKKSEKKCGH